MKNKLLLGILFLIVSSVFSFAATELSVYEKNVEQGEIFVVGIDIETNDSVNGVDFKVRFDPSIINATAEQPGDFFVNANDFSEINNNEGKIVVSIFEGDGTVGLNGSGSLIDITFKALAKNNISVIMLEDVLVYDNAEPIPNMVSVSINNGTVYVMTIEPIVINEIMKNPSAVNDAYGEYVELYNPNAYDVDINGWTLKDDGANNHKIDNNGELIINSGGYLVLCRNNDPLENGNFICDYEYSLFSLDNSNDEVILLNEGGFEVDRVEYDEANFPNPDGASMELKGPSLDNNIGSNWVESIAVFGDGDKGTPGAVNSYMDNDGDGIGNSADNCIDISNPGQADADSDGAGDACDNCPNDSAKVEPGVCGCGAADIDSDGDGIADCFDNCIDISNPGQADADSDGMGDLCDNCPNDSAKVEPDQCGCGIADTDSDLDTKADCVDNCADVYNEDQVDFDGDGEGDACDLDDERDIAYVDNETKTLNVTNETSTKLGITTNGSVKVAVTKKDVTNQSSFSASGIGGFKIIEINTTNDNNVQFPVYMEIYYTDAELAVTGVTENQLVGMFWYNPDTGLWELLNETGVSTTDVMVGGKEYSGYVWANLYHFSQYAPGSDITPPNAYDVLATPNPTDQTYDATLTANITDLQNVDWSNILMAEYFIDHFIGNGNGTNMNAADGAYDSPSELVTATIETSLLSKGTHAVCVHGKDENNNWGNCTNTTFTIDNIAPTITLSYIGFDEDTHLIINLSEKVIDPDNELEEINWSYYGTLTNLAVNVNNNTKMMNISADANFNGIREITLTADDGMDSSEKNITITVDNVNDAPTLAAITNQNINEDSLLQFYLNGADIDPGDTLTYSCDLTALNVGKINDTLANATWTPTNDYVGNHTVNCTVRDAEGEKDSKAFIIAVQNTNDNPVLASIGDKTAVESLLLSFTLSATDEDPTNDTLTFGTNASVGNFNLVGKDVTFTPTYADAGVYDLLFNVSDGKGGKDEEIITLTVNSALEITDLDLTVDGNNYNNIGNGAIVDARPGSNVQVVIELKNMINIDIRGVVVNGTLDTDLGLFKKSSLIPNMDPGQTDSVSLQFELPNIIGEKLYPLVIRGTGEDEDHIMRKVERTVYINVTQKGNEVIVEGINLTPNKAACVKNATLRFNITNRGKYDQNNGNKIKITNEQLGIDIEDAFTIAKNSTIAKAYTFDAITTQTGTFPIKINVTWFYIKTIIENANLEIGKCIDVPEQPINEDTTPPSNWIDLWSYTNDPNYADSYFTYAVESQSNSSLISCSLSGNRYIDCLTPAANQSGHSDINVSVIGGGYSNYDVFRLNVNAVNDAPTAYDISGVVVDEDLSVAIALNCTDIDDASLSYIPNNSSHGALSGSGSSRTYKPNANYNGPDSFTYKCNDGKVDSNTATVGIMVNSVLDEPSISGFSPDGYLLIGDGVSQEFSITVYNPDSIPLTISWYVNNNLIKSGTETKLSHSDTDDFTVKANITNATTNKEHVWNVDVSKVPITTYSGTINNVNDLNVNAFTGLTIINPGVGKIDFGNQTINLSNVVNVDSNVKIQNGIAAINSSAYGFGVFKIPAAITMYGLTHESTPKIYYDAGFTVSGNKECTGTTDPKCTNIVYNVTTGTLTFNADHFTIFFLSMPNRAPTITSLPSTTAILDEEYKYTVTATDPEGDSLRYSLITKPSGMTISGNVIAWTPTNITKGNVTVSVSDGVNSAVTQSWQIEVKEGSKLRISDLDVKVGDKTSKDLGNGDSISRKAKPGDKVKFDIELENTYSKSSDIEIEGITVTVTIENIDDGDDLEEDVDVDDIDAGKDDSVSLEFTIPTLVDEDTYDVIIEVDAEDEDGKDQDVRWELTLEVKKDKHALLIDKADLTTSLISCNRNPALEIEVINIGKEDEDDVSIEIKNTELGLNVEEGGIELEEGNDEDSVFEKTYRLEIDDDVEAGTYPISIKAYYDSKEGDQETVDLTVQDCVEVVTPLETEPVEVITTIPTITEPTAPVTEISFRETSEYLVLLAILFAVLLGGVIFLIGAAIIMMRKK